MPSTLEKIRVLGENTKYDICASTAFSRSEKYPNLFGDSKKSIGNTISAGICHSYTGGYTEIFWIEIILNLIIKQVLKY